jgi:hypothetical protein
MQFRKTTVFFTAFLLRFSRHVFLVLQRDNICKVNRMVHLEVLSSVVDLKYFILNPT